MAWRLQPYLIDGALDNTKCGRVTGWMRFIGMECPVKLNLDGDFSRDIRGTKIRVRRRLSGAGNGGIAIAYMKMFAARQTGKVGDITAGMPQMSQFGDAYIEWYSRQNGRCVLELDRDELQVIRHRK